MQLTGQLLLSLGLPFLRPALVRTVLSKFDAALGDEGIFLSVLKFLTLL